MSWLKRAPPVNRLVVLLILTTIYVVAGKLGLRLAFQNVSASPVWPPTGLALVGALMLGPGVWPAIFVGAFLVAITTAGTVWTSLGIALGNTLEPVVAAWLLRRWAPGRLLGNVRNVMAFTLLAAGFSTAISATMGVTTLALGGLASWVEFRSIWLTWWLGNATGDLVVGTALYLWLSQPSIRWSAARSLEAAALVTCLILAAQVVFGSESPAAARNYPLEFLCIPVLLWASFRFGAREAATAVLLLSAMAIRGTLGGYGPFVRATANESLLLLQAFTASVAVTSLVVAALVTERRRVEARLRELSVRDPLTGLANYRRLVSVLQQEIDRSGRTNRPFALVFFDMDDLKSINDAHGHVVGSRALCRLAEVLRRTCRAVDTVARYGGDEFAAVLPETDHEAAQEMARRVEARLAQDPEEPRLTVSLGVSVFPRDGETAEALLGRADVVLYEMKRGRTPRLEA
jgi:diguanylate cyclase (GGDEF)-like protein